MCATLDHLPMLDNENIVRMLHGLKSVRDDEHSSVLEEAIESLRYLFLTEAVECTCRLIEDDNLWILQEDLCDREALFLSSRETYSPLPDFCLDSERKIIDKFTVRESNHFIYFSIRRYLISERI